MQLNLEAAKGSLLGTTVGDSLGLPYEGLSSKRGKLLMPFPLRQRLLGRKGRISDDTVQSAIVLDALIRCDGDVEQFQKLIASGLRKWFCSIPPGIGLATTTACLKLLVGIPPSKSGVNLAGNGAAMRSAIIGAALSDDPEARVGFVEASARVTHIHPDAIAGAQLVSLAAALQANGNFRDFRSLAEELATEWNWMDNWVISNPSGYVLQSVNAAIALCKYPSESTLDSVVERAISTGGDTDTVVAIVGGILGADVSQTFSDPTWLHYLGWPQPSEISSISQDMRFRVPYPRLLSQHLIALPAILAFGFRRLLPPY